MNELFARIQQPLLERIIALLPSSEPTYLVGGAIRDALLNRPCYDLDFVTSGNAIRIARHIADKLGAAYFPLDVERNVARIILKPTGELNASDNKVIRIDFSTFQGGSMLADLQSRDFTMNALAINVHDLEELDDPLGGMADLVAKRLRACSERSFLDDPVRILRAIRFSVDLDLKIHPETVQLMREAVDKLPLVSAERVRDELFRILMQSHPSTALRILDNLAALEYVLPEICLLKGVQQSPPHILDAWDHTLDTLARLENLLDFLSSDYDPDKSGNLVMGLAGLRLGRFREKLMEHLDSALNPDRPHRGLLFLAGLYHDVGKHKTRSVDQSGKIQFVSHEQIGGKLAEKRGQALKLSHLEIMRIITIVNNHMRPSFLSHQQELPGRKAIYRFFRDTGAAGVDVCILSLADILATYGFTLPQERWIRHLDVVRLLLSSWWEDTSESIFPQPVIDGDLLMAELGLSAGPLIGYLLESIREGQVAGEVHSTQEAISLARKLVNDNLNKKGRDHRPSDGKKS